jgi:hypothetical protein
MKTIDILLPEKNLKDEIEKIWKNNYKDTSLDYYSPLAPESIKTNSILFLGLNPSVSGKPEIGNNPTTWYMNFDTTFGESCDKPHPHFKKFFKLKELISNITQESFSYSYMDLLYWQETDSRKVREKIDTPFVMEQAKLSVEIIKKLKPRLVIVCNSLAGEILDKYRVPINFTAELISDVYQFESEKIPFIIKQSKFMGSAKLWNAKKGVGVKLRNTLLEEIQKILKKTEDWNQPK